MQLLADVPFGRPIAKEVAGALRPLTQKQKQKQRLFRDAVTALSAKALGIPVYTRDLADLRRFYAEVLPY
jgi:predicted nucleic acid-binding protein